MKAPRVVVVGGHAAGHIEPTMNFADALSPRPADAGQAARLGAGGRGGARPRAGRGRGGGYVVVPAYLAARRQGLPIVVYEANARPGVANRLAARMTTHVFTAAPSVRLAHAPAIGIPLTQVLTDPDRIPALADLGRVHIMGITGSGMSALARILFDRGGCRAAAARPGSGRATGVRQFP